MGDAALFPALRKRRRSVDPGRHKYIGGHADVMFGCVAANAKMLPRLKDTVYTMGCASAPTTCIWRSAAYGHSAAARASLPSGLYIARWLEQRPEVLRVLHPALESDRVTKYGNGISLALVDCSASCSSRDRKPRSTLS